MENKSLDELIVERTELLKDIDNIKAQLLHAKMTAAETGVYADIKWYRAANYALNKRQQRIQSVNIRMGQLSREKRATDAHRFERVFIDVCRKRLNEQDFRMVMEEASSIFHSTSDNRELA